MIHNVLQHIGGVANYGIISLCLFFAVFAAVLVWAFCWKKADLDAAAALPLEDDSQAAATSEKRYE
jgi:cbb3-type cytochrome oxidase subunit 3